jgi:tetratricopeptide (TPR) repeat protein
VLVFVSHNTRDREQAQAIEATLRARLPGHDWYIAPRDVVGGAWWVEKLADAVGRADAMLFLAGRQIGPWQQLEYYEALRLSRKRGGRPRLIPVVIAEQAPGLPFFNQLHQIFAADPTDRTALDAIGRALDDSLAADAPPAWQRFQPYKGLPALDEADAAFFFGRDAETAAILDLMARRPDRIVALIGQSGVGKSSLARAGILARLKSQLWPLETGAWPAGLRDSRAFLPLVIRPDEEPLKELARAFAQLYCTTTFDLDAETAGWARRFAEGAGLRDLLRATRDRLGTALGAEPPKRFVVYLDQGEELYTRATPDGARRFSALLAEAAGHEAFSVLMSLRSDYYAAWQIDSDLFAASEHVDVLPLTRDVLGEIVRRPALLLEARFESGDIAERVASATEREPGALPLLSDLLHEMWLNMQARGDGVLRWSDNPELVDVAAPLRRRAETFLADPANDEATIRRLFTLRLAHVPEIGEPVRRRADRAECGAAEWAAAEKLAGPDWRLLTLASAADGAPVVEVAHEQLLQRWPRLRSWLDEERDFLVWKGEAERAAAAHAALPESERSGALLLGRPLAIARGWFERRGADLSPETRDFVAASRAADDARRDAEQRRQRKIQIGTTIGLVVALAFAGLAGWQWRMAETERGVAEAQTKEAKSQRDHAARTLALATQTANGLIFDLAQKFENSGVPVETIKAILDSAGKLQDQLAAGGETSPELQRSRAAASEELVDTLLQAGDTKGALAAAQQARDLCQTLVRSAPANTDYQLLLSIADEKNGDVLVAQGNLPEALKSYRDDLAIRERLAKSDPGNAQWQRDLSVSYEKVGNVLMAQGNLPEALKSYRDSLAIRERLAKSDPGNSQWRLDLAIAYDNVADVFVAQGHLDEALSSRRKANAFFEALARADPGNAQWQRDLSVSDNKIGDVLVAQGDLPEALKSYREDLAIAERLAKSDPGNAGWQRDLSVSYEKVGDVLEAQVNLPEALKSHRDSLAIRERLAKSDPGNAQWQRDLSVSYAKLGDVYQKSGDKPEALRALTEGRTIIARLCQLSPDTTQWRQDLAWFDAQLKSLAP